MTDRIPAPTAGVASLELLNRSASALRHASRCPDASRRYIEAHLAALRAAAALVAARRQPAGRSRPRSVWQALAEASPELTEWAAFFAASGRRRAVLERGVPVSSVREADDLLRQAETFLAIVHDLLGVPRLGQVTAYVTPAGVGGGRG